MGKKQVLFVAYHDENLEAGFPYAIDLPKTMNEDISILMIYRRKKALEKLEDYMAVIAFAEEGELKTARDLITNDLKERNESYEEKAGLLIQRCMQSSIAADVGTTAMDVVSAVKNILRQNTKIDMVLLSPEVTGSGNITAKELNRLVKTASRPIVTMSKNTQVT